MTVVFKISFGEDTRRISFEEVPSFLNFIELIRGLFRFEKNEIFTLKYEDDEKDQISITSDLELNEAFKFFKECKLRVLRLYLYKNSSLSSSSLPSPVNTSLFLSGKEKDNEKEREMEALKRAQEELLAKQIAEEEEARKIREELKKREEEEKKREAEDEEKKRKEEEKAAQKLAEERKKRLEEEEEATRKFLEQEATRKFLEQEAKSPEEKKKNSNSGPIIKEYLARNGDRVKLDVSSQSLSRYGVAPFARILAPNGPGTIIGVDLNKGHLWFKMDQDRGVSFWDDITSHDAMICKGITMLDPAVDRNIPSQKKVVQEAPPVSASLNDEEWEKQMIEKAIQESLLDAEQERIKKNYQNSKK